MKPGEVALVRFPFSELAAAKKRPALVLARTMRSPRYRLVTVAMITSQIEALKLEGDVLLADWEGAGLLHPSLLRLAKVATVDEGLIDRWSDDSRRAPFGRLARRSVRCSLPGCDEPDPRRLPPGVEGIRGPLRKTAVNLQALACGWLNYSHSDGPSTRSRPSAVA